MSDGLHEAIDNGLEPYVNDGYKSAIASVEREVREWLLAHREEIADAVLAERKDRYNRSFDIECPLCHAAVGHECMNLGSAGGPANHTERIEAVPKLSDEEAARIDPGGYSHGL